MDDADTLMLPLQARSMSLRADSFDDEANTVDLVWTTGAPVLRYDWRSGTTYIEVLDVTPKALRLGRLNAGAPFLNTHCSYDLSNVIGAVVDDSVRIASGEGTATMQLSRDPAHAGIVANIRAKVIRNVSVGYLIHQVVKTEGDDGKPATWRVTDWEPIEISAVPIPADPGAQMRSAPAVVGQLHPCRVTVECRAAPSSPASPTAAPAASSRETAMDPVVIETPVASDARATPAVVTTAPAVPVPAAPAVDAALAERTRAKEIRSIGRKLRLAETVVDAAIDTGTTIEAFRAQAIDAAADAQERAARPHEPGLSDHAHRVYAEPAEKLPKGTNATRAMLALAATRGDRNAAAAYLSKHYGRQADVVARALSTSIGSAGGFLVPPEMSTEVIELLRPASAVMALDPVILPMPSGNLNVPRLAGGAQANYAGENQPAPASQESFGMVQLSAKKLNDNSRTLALAAA